MAKAVQVEEAPIRIICDKAESRSGVIEGISGDPGYVVESADLLAGDYVLEGGIAVERKEATDFVASIMDRRLFSQIQLMKAHYKQAIVIVEGDIYKTRSAIQPAALDGAISYITVLEGVPVIPTKNASHTAAMLKTAARHAQNGLGYEIALRAGKPKDQKVLSQYVIEGLPGVGAGVAKKLLSHFGSVKAVMNATEADLCEVPGVGKKAAERILSAIEADWS